VVIVAVDPQLGQAGGVTIAVEDTDAPEVAGFNGAPGMCLSEG
jgi:hypothetical protein